MTVMSILCKRIFAYSFIQKVTKYSFYAFYILLCEITGLIIIKASKNMYKRVKNVYYQCIKSHFKCKTLANYIMCVNVLHLK